uniref:HCK proto-oncogene, Src family tyrosine kinase n=1 Tax=Gorilla gorilla gorilla TaxID=9595 RepID=A0A2I2Y646_GORGO
MGGRSSCEDPGCPRDEERAPRQTKQNRSSLEVANLSQFPPEEDGMHEVQVPPGRRQYILKN